MDQTERNIEIIKRRIEAQIAELRKDLTGWIERHTEPVIDDTPDSKFRGSYTAISAALLDTAIDRHIALHGGPDARELILAAFDKRLAAYKRSLQ